jgi:hypothetical protein
MYWSMAKIERVCNYCGNVFFVYPYVIKTGQGKYCSKACYDNSLVGKKSKRWAYGKTQCECVICGNTFERTPSSILAGGGKYCSRKCSDVGHHRTIVCVCETCGITFTVTPSEKARGVGRCCSKKCMGALYKKMKLGENNPMWAGGKSFEPYCPKFNDELKEYIRGRFGRKCVVCGQPENGRKLAVHHVDYNKLQGCKGKTWSLIPLCHSCHTKTNCNRHHWFNLLSNYWATNPEIHI